MSEHDQRQYERMLQALESVVISPQHLGTVIVQISALLEVLHNQDSPTCEEIRTELATLEEIYAVALDRKEKSFSSKDQSQIRVAIQIIKNNVTVVLQWK